MTGAERMARDYVAGLRWLGAPAEKIEAAEARVVEACHPEPMGLSSIRLQERFCAFLRQHGLKRADVERRVRTGFARGQRVVHIALRSPSAGGARGNRTRKSRATCRQHSPSRAASIRAASRSDPPGKPGGGPSLTASGLYVG